MQPDLPLTSLVPGDLLYARTEINNDGSHPDFEVGQCIASPGARGVLIKVGHAEDDPTQEVYLVRFESKPGELGPPIGCWPTELTTQP